VGPYSINEAHTLEELTRLKSTKMVSAFIPIGEITSWMPRLHLGESVANGVLHGRPPHGGNLQEQLHQLASPSHVRLVGPVEEFLAIATLQESSTGDYVAVLEKVFPHESLS
jgi:tRNA U55 pseudouridine synthase TruB